MKVTTYDNVPFSHDQYRAAEDRYRRFGYRRVGSSGLQLPPISLGFWYNFGDNRPFAAQREIFRCAFDRGITHFDLANNYGPLMAPRRKTSDAFCARISARIAMS